jgi:hypothetical protein
MRWAAKCSIRPALEGLEDRQLLSTAMRGHALLHPAAQMSHAVPLTGVESGTYSVRIQQTSMLREHFLFRGTGTIDGLGPARISGTVTVAEDLSRAGTAWGTITLTLLGGKGTTRAAVTDTVISAHTGSRPSVLFQYSFSGGTDRFRRGFDSGSGTLTRTSMTTTHGGAKGDFTVQLFSNNGSGPTAGG